MKQLSEKKTMKDCDKQKDPRRVAAGKKAAETRKKKQAVRMLGAAAVGATCTLL